MSAAEEGARIRQVHEEKQRRLRQFQVDVKRRVAVMDRIKKEHQLAQSYKAVSRCQLSFFDCPSAFSLIVFSSLCTLDLHKGETIVVFKFLHWTKCGVDDWSNLFKKINFAMFSTLKLPLSFF